MDEVPGWLEKILLPQVGELKGEIRAVNGRLTGLESKTEGLDHKIQRLENKFDGEFARSIPRSGGSMERLARSTNESTFRTGSRWSRKRYASSKRRTSLGPQLSSGGFLTRSNFRLPSFGIRGSL